MKIRRTRLGGALLALTLLALPATAAPSASASTWWSDLQVFFVSWEPLGWVQGWWGASDSEMPERQRSLGSGRESARPFGASKTGGFFEPDGAPVSSACIACEGG